ncbi:TerB family tellurite resistance protein [Parahaliea sp. F7430]|uniref:TerB family tellurite resistance protein n=1 Tax=Sediminihaliea albiluteola TaxID=2758564 RepID=A0A7W2YJ53_9GAMM|nr:TerB family tellurite resistance protein [Sediminihaliea albiluteola]MBA6411933.1 TerB family tellurite resistance protein [Sediminihaliea albiluteola]
MIQALKSLFVQPAKESPEALQQRLNLATAAILVETAQADFEQDSREQQLMQELLCDSLALPREEVQALVQQAQARVEQATSLYEFTRLINDNFDAEAKSSLILAMWRVAYADGNLDKYEEALIRQVADLTYVPHSEYIRCKLLAKSAQKQR